jgi:hypothetical protein
MSSKPSGGGFVLDVLILGMIGRDWVEEDEEDE